MTTTASETTPARAPGTVPALVGTSFDRRGRSTQWRVMPDHGGGFTLQWYSEFGKRWECEVEHPCAYPSVNDFKLVKVFKTLAAARAALRRRCPNEPGEHSPVATASTTTREQEIET